ncbi:hypothetical protein [Micromonospora sp. RTGN7]|uniref:hypothetical protein n=1 Tax=Micromonospora sp. RTGN7 TaxID=3016526 RepID=UPI0029FF4AFD|nr:hypothetical protein [Micromonospora sp. RTGN7]
MHVNDGRTMIYVDNFAERDFHRRVVVAQRATPALLRCRIGGRAEGSVALGESMIDSGLPGGVCLAGEVVVSCPVRLPVAVGVRRVAVPA